MSKIIIKIDASAFKNASCMLAFYNTVVKGYRYGINNNDVEFGSAVHLFLKLMCENGGNFGVALPRSIKYLKSTPMKIKYQKKYLDELHLMKVCTEYWEWLKINDDFEILCKDDGKPAVEVTFSNKYYEDDDVIVYLEGTIDRIGKVRNGCYAFRDYKTTSANDVALFFTGYELSTQLMFYYINLHMYAQNNPGSFIAEMCKHTVGAFIDAIFLNGKDKITFESSKIFMFKKENIEIYRHMMHLKIMSLIDYVKRGVAPLPEGILTDTCSKPENSSGGAWRCRYFPACAAVDDRARMHVMNNEFITKPYEPLSHGKE